MFSDKRLGKEWTRKMYRRKKRILFSIIVIVMIGITFGTIKSLHNAKNGYVIYEEYINRNPGDSLDENIETISKLEIWNELNEDEKNKVLYAILRVENRYLGISNMPKVGICELDSYSGYDDDENRIYISRDIYENPEDPYIILECMAHEMFHCYQHDLIELYSKLYSDKAYQEKKNLLLFSSSIVYGKEILEYENGYKDLEKYRTQELEIDAYQYSMDTVNEYRERVAEYLNKKNE